MPPAASWASRARAILPDVADESSIGGILGSNPLVGVRDLVNAVGYLVPSYTNVDVHYINGGAVAADAAGGFAGDFQSGKVENGANSPWAVYNIAQVTGGSYAGGFGGKVTSGALADAGGGVGILGLKGIGIGVDGLADVLGVYVPSIVRAGVKSDADTKEDTSGAQLPDPNNPGLVVEATRMDTVGTEGENKTAAGSAGGFIGYGSGVQVSYCNVTQLRHTNVTEPKKLEGADGAPYFDTVKSSYAVKAPHYAGGFMGMMDIGSAASVGKSLTASVLTDLADITGALSALSVVVSTVEHSHVSGGTGGFAVLASETGLENTQVGSGVATPGSAENPVGSAGGFAGAIAGGHIQDSNVLNFSYVIGQVEAGGYAGGMAPGSVAASSTATRRSRARSSAA